MGGEAGQRGKVLQLFQVRAPQPLRAIAAFREHVTEEAVCSRVHAPQKQLGKSIQRALADDEGLLSRWTGRMLFASVTELWADSLPMKVTGIPLVFFVWSWPCWLIHTMVVTENASMVSCFISNEKLSFFCKKVLET